MLRKQRSSSGISLRGAVYSDSAPTIPPQPYPQEDELAESIVLRVPRQEPLLTD
jgi:hypothetical protein